VAREDKKCAVPRCKYLAYSEMVEPQVRWRRFMCGGRKFESFWSGGPAAAAVEARFAISWRVG